MVKRKNIASIIKSYLHLNSHDMKRTFFFLKPFIQNHWKAYSGLIILLGFDIFLTISFAWFFGQITDAALQGDFEKLKWLIPIGIVLIILSITTSFLDIIVENIATNGVKNELKKYLYSHLLRLPSPFTVNQQSGKLSSHFSNDIHHVNGLIGKQLIGLLRFPLIFLVVFIYLCQINTVLSLISVMIAPLALMSAILFGFLLKKNGRLIHELIADINNHLNETFFGLPIIRSFTLEKHMFNKLESQTDRLYQLECHNARLQGYYYAGGQLVSSITYLISVSLGAYYVSHSIMTVGALLTFINLVNHLVYPLTGMAGQWAGFQRSITALERIVNVLEEKPTCEKLPSHVAVHQIHTPIHLQNISFGYSEDDLLFQQFHLHAPAGKVTALVGPSGAGKSTIFNLLQGFYSPAKGYISIAGRSIGDYSISELRCSIAHVPQETFLFAGTIRDNLQIARPDVTEEEMEAAAKQAYIHDFILTLPNGYDTHIGERGLKLSGGERQRIAIARAILKDAPILLLDEPTSALDSETEHSVREALKTLMKDRTTIIIAHRLSTIQHADVIFVMDQGRIVQQGTHEQLLIEPGLYQRLCSKQFQADQLPELTLMTT
ncbi:ABC transporter ATP-binding protein [Falsibacillus albus]|nr:ABC transporter ATP-binding protein [Falsibacillus albus]